MRVLVVNCGSATLKVDLLEATSTEPPQKLTGLVEPVERERQADAVRAALDRLGGDRVDAVGHRIVHGGERFVAPVVVDDEVVAALAALEELAPLHNGPAVAALRASRELLGTRVPMVATFDTAFHAGIPDRARLYAIPVDVAQAHHVRRFGFHGLAHRYMAERYSQVTRRELGEIRLVTLQLGGGCSAAAISGGRSVDTSMGVTPLEGLVMATRSGDLDPAVPTLLAAAGTAVEEIDDLLNRRSGLLGLSGISGDMRELIDAERRGDSRAGLAIDVFCYRARKYVGAYLAALSGADALVFGGGIGERAPEIRSRVCSGMEWAGIELDARRNAVAVGEEARIGREGSRVDVRVLPVDESAIIARDTAACLAGSGAVA